MADTQNNFIEKKGMGLHSFVITCNKMVRPVKGETGKPPKAERGDRLQGARRGWQCLKAGCIAHLGQHQDRCVKVPSVYNRLRGRPTPTIERRWQGGKQHGKKAESRVDSSFPWTLPTLRVKKEGGALWSGEDAHHMSRKAGEWQFQWCPTQE